MCFMILCLTGGVQAAEQAKDSDTGWVTVRDFETGTEGYTSSSGTLTITDTNALSGKMSLSIPVTFPGNVDITKAGGVGKYEAISFGVYVPDGWPRVECFFYLQDKDGLWWQSEPIALKHPAPSAWTIVTIDLYRDLHPVNNGAPFQKWLARDIKMMGIRFICRSQAQGNILFDRLRARRLPEPPLAIESVDLQKEATTFRPFSAEIRLSRDFFNPFDPDEINLICKITTPDGKELIQPCYFDQDYKREPGPDGRDAYTPIGKGRFKLRFAPFMPGEYLLQFTAKSGTYVTQTIPCKVRVEDNGKGFPLLRVSEDKKNFETVAGAPFYPIGHNLRSPTDDRCTRVLGWDDLPDRGLSAIEKYFEKMSKAGENLAEVWMSSWWLDIEWNRAWKGYHGLGWYNLEHAWMLDRLLEESQQRNLYVHLVIDNHGKYSSYCDEEWEFSPFNTMNGGPLANPDQFFTDDGAFKLYKQKMRYILARWGGFTNIMGLEMISELDLTGSHQGTYREPRVLDWHRKASAYIRNMDIHKHLLTTHFSGDYHVIDARIAQDDCLDYIVVDAYRNGVSDFPSNVREAAANLVMYKKPFMITEYGGAWNGTDELGLEADLHSGIWAYWMTPAGGTPLLWWFDFIDRRNLYYHFTAFKAFTDGEDRRKNSG